MANKLIDPQRLERLRNICLGLPEATEQEAWEHPTWRIRNKIFAMQAGDETHHRASVWLKASDGVQDFLIQENPKLYFSPPYVGHKGWVGVYLDNKTVPWKALEELIRDSYCLVAPKKLVKALQEEE